MLVPAPLFLALLAPPTSVELVRVGRYAGGEGTGAEIVTVQAATRRLAVSYSELGAIDLLDLDDPAAPRRTARVSLELESGEALTSIAFEPRRDRILCAIQAADSEAPGFVSVRSGADGRELVRLPAGVGPDAITVDPTGRLALVANEGEAVVRDRATGELGSPPGSLTLIRLADEPAGCVARQVALAPVAVEGPPELLGRSLEREVDGAVELVPLTSYEPAWLEPEVAAFDPTGTTAFVTLQEHNAVLRLAIERTPAAGAELVLSQTCFTLGTTRHPADLEDDGRVAFEDELFALREPDGIAVTPDGACFVTADEGDTDPKASRTPVGRPAGGGRTVSVFDARDGTLLGDTGGQLDRAAAAAGLYPDRRSDAKGSEPEMVVAFELDGRAVAAVTLERADAVALIDLRDPRAPRVAALCGVGPERGPAGPEGPEGIAHFFDVRTGDHYLYTANEASGAVAALLVRSTP